LRSLRYGLKGRGGEWVLGEEEGKTRVMGGGGGERSKLEDATRGGWGNYICAFRKSQVS
jgi:hypothetical protein